MKKVYSIFSILALGLTLIISTDTAQANGVYLQQERNQTTVPQRSKRGTRDRKSGRGIGTAYKKAGKGAARGAKRFAKNIAKGKPLKAGKEFGKGMGSFGKHTGIGTARVGKKIGRTMKRTF